VVVSSGSSAFHAVASCPLLTSGQRAVERRGGNAGLAQDLQVERAIGKGFFPCQGCFPAAGGKA
jgi:hypothetical protein